MAIMEITTGRKKAATLLLSLRKEQIVQALKQLSESEVEELTMEIARIQNVSPSEQDKVIEDFIRDAKQSGGKVHFGGIEYAKDILEKVLGKDKATTLLKDFRQDFQLTPFEFLDKADPENVIRFIQDEQPQTIALILAYLNPKKAGQLLSLLPEDIQPEVARRIAVMDQTPPNIVRQIEKVLTAKISSVITHQDFSTQGGVNSLAEVINSVDRSTEKKILEYLEEVDPQLSVEVKDLMFVFEDIIDFEDRQVQRLLQDVEMKDLPLALKVASEELKTLIFKNLSDRAVETLKEEMEFMGPVRVKEVEDMQRKIVNIVRNLEEAGEIFLSRGGEEEEEFV
ncbi:MAG: flagellar motor switch protein FliG [Candidatus Margulisbacteria bacterium]|nr:flagellar motor switch protein FliG [Candidatus Margulisiibacteriota bacterium]